MKKFLTIFAGLMIVLPVFADENDPVPETPAAPTYPSDVVVSASYVRGAYEAAVGQIGTTVGTLSDLDTTAQNNIVAAVNEVNTAVGTKQATLTSSNVTTTGTGPVVTAVEANNGSVSVTTGEITIPVGGASGNSITGHATIWLQ